MTDHGHGPNDLMKPATLGDLLESQARILLAVRSSFLSLGDHLSNMECRIMSDISERGARMDANFAATAEGLTKINAAVVKLDDLVTKLQGTQGQITPEDQAILDQIEAGSGALRAMTEAAVATTEDGVPPGNVPPGNVPPTEAAAAQAQRDRDAATRARGNR